jgi:hypothetical protein
MSAPVVVRDENDADDDDDGDDETCGDALGGAPVAARKTTSGAGRRIAWTFIIHVTFTQWRMDVKELTLS